MEARLVEFARLLRQSGVRVSPVEVADAGRALALVGTGEREGFRAALRATLVKRSSDVPLFEQLFAIYFSGLGRLLDGVERGLLAELDAPGLLEGDELRDAALALHQLLDGLSPLARAALTGERGAVARLFEGAAAGLDWSALVTSAQVGFYGRRLFGAAGGGAAARDLASVEEALRRRGLSPRALDLVSGRLRAALDALEEAARRYAALEQRARAEARRRKSLTPSGFASLSRADVERMEVAVRRLAERLRARLAARERARRGALHVRRTLRRNMGLGGLPARLAFRRKRPERPDVVVLCDVSDSVRHVSRLMLLFLHTLQGLFTRVRSFVFVSDLGEVTEAFRKERDVARAADLATAGQVVSLYGNSNYGRALKTFHDRYRGAVTRRTTVIVIGDGRNNYNPPAAWVLEELSRRARRVVWICPEERWAWGQGDSEMPLYASKVERVATVTTLAELEGVADALLPRRARH
ncbi:MAG TPA: VWA domain-containing protein [Anaeromyxobacteraceae bacterium]